MATHIKICLTVGFILFFVIVKGENVIMVANILKCFKFDIKEFLHCIKSLFVFGRGGPQVCLSKNLNY